MRTVSVGGRGSTAGRHELDDVPLRCPFSYDPCGSGRPPFTLGPLPPSVTYVIPVPRPSVLLNSVGHWGGSRRVLGLWCGQSRPPRRGASDPTPVGTKRRPLVSGGGVPGRRRGGRPRRPRVTSGRRPPRQTPSLVPRRDDSCGVGWVWQRGGPFPTSTFLLYSPGYSGGKAFDLLREVQIFFFPYTDSSVCRTFRVR